MYSHQFIQSIRLFVFVKNEYDWLQKRVQPVQKFWKYLFFLKFTVQLEKKKWMRAIIVQHAQMTLLKVLTTLEDVNNAPEILPLPLRTEPSVQKVNCDVHILTICICLWIVYHIVILNMWNLVIFVGKCNVCFSLLNIVHTKYRILESHLKLKTQKAW